MEKKIGNNVSSGAEKVEKVEAYTEQQVDPVTPKKTTAKKTTTVKKSTAPKKTAMKKAETTEKTAAKKRVAAAKEKVSEKEEKLHKKAELKQKKLEKRAELKAKKIEKRAALAEKKAERKQKKLEKRAELKDKRVERRAERIARREMLKNESKSERQKRLEREKRERIALKRQKKESRDKARENKLKARQAAHARKASDRKHRREQTTQRKQNRRGFGGWLAAVISLGVACLALATIVTAGAFRMNDMQVEAESGARATLYELVSVSEEMDNNLAKLRVSSGVDEQRTLLTDLLVQTAVMESDLEKIPVDAVTSTDISSFVNRTGSFARMMLSRLAAGKTLTQEEKSAIAQLYEINAALASELNTLANGMTEKDLRAFLGGKQGAMSEGFGEMGNHMREKREISDAPFAGHGNVGENRLSALEEITEAQAEEAAKNYFTAYHVQNVQYTGETTARDVTCYNFVLTDENGVEIFAEITKNGGKLAFFDTYEKCEQKNFDLETCDSLAKEFLAELGIDNVEAVWLSDAGMVANITYVTSENGVRVYPEIIRVRVCESKGRVVGIDARGYLLNNEGERSSSAAISEEEAKSLLSVELEVTASNLAIIPVHGREILCYEFACNYGEEQYVIYLDATTGAEVQVFRVRQSARGSYLD